MLTKKTQKNPKNFLCEICGFVSSNIKDYKRHISTRKHKMLTNVDNCIIAKSKKPIQTEIFACECGKVYKHRQSLSVHKKKCNFVDNSYDEPEEMNTITTENETKSNTIVMKKLLTMLDQQQEVNQKLSKTNEELTQVIKEGKLNSTVNNTTNNSFNLNLFLNEKCKNALNISEFIETIQLQLNDLVETGKLGHVDGISRIFVNALNDLDETKRPIHCTDIKRETVYIKDEDDTWKRDNNKLKLKSAINTIADKNLEKIPEWQNDHPNFSEIDTQDNQEYIQLTIHSIGADSKEETEKNQDKIAKNVLKEVLIDKN
tara:strand:- start:2761 stop:3708 length:948 start_codon:yes stop_codon:yes gene_type:complete